MANCPFLSGELLTYKLSEMLRGRLQCGESRTESFPELLTITSPIRVETHCGCQKSACNVSPIKF